VVEIVQYVRNNGKCAFEEWFDSLNTQVATKVKRAIDRMEDGNFGDQKSVGSGVLERRINHGPGYRVYFGRDGDRLVILLGEGTKSRQSRDIRAAQDDWVEYKSTKPKQE